MLGTPIFATIDDPALFNPASGRLDAIRIATELQLSLETIADTIGRRAASLREYSDARSLQSELRRVGIIWATLVHVFAGDKPNARIFLIAPHHALENQAPVDFLKRRDLEPLEGLLEAMCIRQVP